MEAAISTQHITIPLSADTAGAAYNVSYYHFIPDRKGTYPKIFLQAGLHADEQPLPVRVYVRTSLANRSVRPCDVVA